MAITSAFQADDEGSIPSTCSNKTYKYIFVSFLFFFKFGIFQKKWYNYSVSNYINYICGYSLVVEFHASDLKARVRFPLPAPKIDIAIAMSFNIKLKMRESNKKPP